MRASRLFVLGGVGLLALALLAGGDKGNTGREYAGKYAGAPTDTTREAGTREGTPPSDPTTTTTTHATPTMENVSPLVGRLPHTEAHFTVDHDLVGGAVHLRVTLRAVLNHGAQRPQYMADLAAYKAEARAWLAANGADPSMPVEWLPPAAAHL